MLDEGSGPLTEEKCTVREVRQITGSCAATVIRLFENEPGFIVLKCSEKMHKRRLPEHSNPGCSATRPACVERMPAPPGDVCQCGFGKSTWRIASRSTERTIEDKFLTTSAARISALPALKARP
jgi:hypothetical protein